MVGRLNLPNVCDHDHDDPLLDMISCSSKAERPLDSPDSGLPPSPSPSAWLLLPGPGSQQDRTLAEDPAAPGSEDEPRASLVGHSLHVIWVLTDDDDDVKGVVHPKNDTHALDT